MKNIKNPYYPRPSTNALWDAISCKNAIARSIANELGDEIVLTLLTELEQIIGTQNLPSARDEYEHEKAKEEFSRKAAAGLLKT